MNQEASELFANALENDIALQEKGQYLQIGEKWDDIYAEILPVEDNIDNQIYQLAFRFWDDWGDAANHNWLYHEPITKEQWPIYAKKVVESLRLNKLPEDQLIIKEFMPKPKVKLRQRVKQWLGKHT